jgi:hypothetical protein
MSIKSMPQKISDNYLYQVLDGALSHRHIILGRGERG